MRWSGKATLRRWHLNWGLNDKEPAMWRSGEEHFRQREQQALVQRPWDSKKLDLSEEQPGDQCGWEQNEQRGWLEKKSKRWAGPCRPWWRGWIFWVGSYWRILQRSEMIWFFFFFKIFFSLMWTIFKIFIEFVIISFLFYVLVFYSPGMWDLSSLTRDWTRTLELEGKILTPGLSGKSRDDLIWKDDSGCCVENELKGAKSRSQETN